MKVVALVSGGKDSCYAMMRCIHFGHEIVALANLVPECDSVDELDSYMYQTVGHQIVEAYAQCMGLPLFRKRIQGKPKAFDLKYSETNGDEVEDLEVLLRHVKSRIPSVDAVSSGAIASDYQRLRVENVCSRLGLVSLAYLWKQDQTELLQQMVDSGISAILIKVASMGLQPQIHLGMELSAVFPVLTQLHEQFGANVCGEGGEYESLTLDCPLFKNGRIVLDESSTVLVSTSSIVQVGFLHPKRFHVEHKGLEDNRDTGKVYWVADEVERSQCLKKQQSWTYDEATGECRVSKTEDYVTISCWLATKTHKGAGEDLSRLLYLTLELLAKEDLGWDAVLYIHLYVESMKDFAQINSMYSQHITEADCPRGVPSRSTVEVPLAACGLGDVMVEVFAARNTSKKVLHVQSISCWAPSCIGPYSQATLHGNILFMAGQIGLDPPTMALVTDGPAAETLQCLQNARAVAESFGSASTIFITVYCSLSLNKQQREEVESQCTTFFGDGAVLPIIFYVLVSSLPKGSSVEVEPLLTCLSSNEASDVEASGMTKKLVHALPAPAEGICSSDCFSIPGHICRALVSVRSSSPLSSNFSWLVELVASILKDADLQWSDISAFRVYFVGKKTRFDETAVRSFFEAHFPALVVVPVHGLGHDTEFKVSLTLDIVALRSLQCT
ncbi:diphthine--ammonia ligase isoform X1 [Selaginella moellendorffii]|uniref:diphthine--ammonia ligase isoform X1 n=1 Tax=Selaginella moellendorffii TaxID=88036 RepID=UPI000D1CB4CD|nr:diphthine--ammonia ligase isoform X1 [Selaginella moellendorffii]XP_024519294.1 diphthine--ammonia ligase isoform X1 [Selaginella moellendorffii]XP_024519295.1 diphthine--ammonia ligase isoform X1 [Selaginella moellendorffii]|eukprot:XP_024519293.1 diphthine--ammonia ligase isoform X1 [Selaginella moellendorffii]